MELKNKKPMIFIITGKARHGKDTTAMIIEKIYSEKGLKTINLQYSSYIKEYAKRIAGWDGSEATKPRTLLQQLGTELIKKEIDNMFFIEKIIDDIKVYSYFFDVITISDGRSEEEIDSLKKIFINVAAISVIRHNFDNGLTEKQKKHFTEVALDDYHKFDYVLNNDGTIEELEINIRKMIKEVNHVS